MQQKYITVTIRRPASVPCPTRMQRHRARRRMYTLASCAWLLAAVAVALSAGLFFTVAEARPAPNPEKASQTEQELITAPAAYTTTPHSAKASVILSEPEESDLIILAQTLWGEARGCTTTHQSAVIWCILNRVDDPRWPDTIAEVCVPNQFLGYNPDNPVDPELYALCEDVYARWTREQTEGYLNTGRTLPREYVFFHGDGVENHFRTAYEFTGEFWDWSLSSPYST